MDNEAQRIEEQVFKHCFDLYKKAKGYSENIEKYLGYYKGKSEAGQTSNNVIEQITETKLTLMLDSQMTMSVLPNIASFDDMKRIQDLQDIADIYNDALKHVLRSNNFEMIKQNVARWGFIGGFSPIETLWNPDNGKFGDIEIRTIDPRKIKFDPVAKEIKQAQYVTIEMEVSPLELKKKYAIKSDGTFDEEKAKKIDKIASVMSESKPKESKAIISYQDDKTGTAGQAFSGVGGLKSAGSVCKLIKVYLRDDSTFTPDPQDTSEKSDTKDELRAMYPNGRMIVISAKEGVPIVLNDQPLPECFQDGFNIDIFNPKWLDSIEGRGEVEPLISVQERLNRAYERLRTLVAKYVSIICLDKGLDVDLSEGDLVNQFVVFIENYKQRGMPDILTNNTLAEIQNLLNYIMMLKSDAKEIARVNDTMINGTQQPGTSSARQVQALQESPQSSIRAIQRNWRDFLVSVGNKVLALVQEMYDYNRMIKLSTSEYAQFDTKQETGPDGKPVQTQVITLYDQAGKAIKEIKTNKDFKLEVEIIAGTEIPRTRQENAQLTQQLVQQGVFDLKDPDVLDQYLKAIDYPFANAVVNTYKKKLEQAQAQQKPQLPPIEKIGLAWKDMSPELRAMFLQNMLGSQVTPEMTLTPDEKKTQEESQMTEAMKQPTPEQIQTA